ncbi:MAG: nuclear transport factor 2 family protein [Candidatus Nanopelagicales bacterium]|jgi:hypothetical protein
MPSAHEQTVVDLVQAFAGGDSAAVKSRLADGLVAHVTQSDGSTRQVVGSANYAAIVDAMDPLSANLQMEIPQIMTIEPGLVMAMFEVHAARYGRRLHNFSGQLFRFDGDVIDRIWMVEALPRESDEFWSATE